MSATPSSAPALARYGPRAVRARLKSLQSDDCGTTIPGPRNPSGQSRNDGRRFGGRSACRCFAGRVWDEWDEGYFLTDARCGATRSSGRSTTDFEAAAGTSKIVPYP